MRGTDIGFVFQSFHLLEQRTCLENVMLSDLYNGTTERESRARAYEALEAVGLGAFDRRLPTELSGGQQQRVAIARALASDPAVLLCDEPTGNLDVATGEAIIKLLFDLNAQSGTTLVLVTHDMNLARRCQRVLNLQHGQLNEINIPDNSGVH